MYIFFSLYGPPSRQITYISVCIEMTLKLQSGTERRMRTNDLPCLLSVIELHKGRVQVHLVIAVGGASKEAVLDNYSFRDVNVCFPDPRRGC